MFMVIPSVVMLDRELSTSAQMLYGVITWKCNQKAFCWQTNRALGEILVLAPKRVSALLSDLETRGHIETEIIRDEETGQVLQRNIYPIVKSSKGINDPIPKNEDTPPLVEKDTSPRKEGEPIPKNAEEKEKEENINNIPPKAPQGAAGAKKRRGREPQSTAAWKAERFEAFWQAYPCGKNRQAAIRAWDKLRPDEALIHEMARGLKRAMESEEWQRGIGIPYASTWLNNQRWTDTDKGLPGGQASPAEQSMPPQRWGWD